MHKMLKGSICGYEDGHEGRCHSVATVAHAREKAKERWKIQREKVLRHYGGECACCKETAVQFLGFDHIRGEGAEHRRNDPSTRKIVRWLIANDYPEGIVQILCYNCNMAKGMYGRCPHESTLTKELSYENPDR